MLNKEIFQLKNIAGKLVFINFIVFGLQLFLGNGFTEMFILSSQDIFSRPWILLTSIFLHGSTTHLLFNTYALSIFGSLVEERIGSKRFLITYLLSGIFASLAFAIATPFGKALGASGAIMAIIGLVVIMLPKMKILFFLVIPMNMRQAGILMAIVDLIGFGFGSTGIGHIAHLGGFFIGISYGVYLKKKKKELNYQLTKVNKTKNNDDIELSQEEINQYIKYGKI